MATSTVDPDTLLAIDIGSVHTRAALFDVVEGRYQVVAMGIAPSTAHAPWHDVREGVGWAVEQIQRLTGRLLLDEEAQIVTPTQPDGSGVDLVAVTLSAGKPLSVVCVGALQSISLNSVRRLAESTYARVVESFHLNDRLGLERRLERMVRARPDLVLLGGGTDGGAQHTVLDLVEAVGLGAYLLPPQQKPLVLYVGNRELVPQIRSRLETVTQVIVGPNVRPNLDTERLSAAHTGLVEAFRAVRLRQFPGLQALEQAARGNVYPTATTFGRMVRYLSRLYEPERGVLGVDVGASATTLAAGWGGRLVLKVYPDLGLGEQATGIVEATSAEAVARWVPETPTPDEVLNVVHTKALLPDSVPMALRELALEHALGRQALQAALSRAYTDFPQAVWQPQRMTPLFDLILLSGSLFTRASRPGRALLTALDGLQPIGVSTFVLDQNHLLSALGSAAAVNPPLSIQVLESPHFVPLATVVAPIWKGRFGSRLLTAHLEYASGRSTKVELKAGALEVVPVPQGQRVKLTLRLAMGVHLGTRRRKREVTLQVVGSRLGLVLDGRGRPLRLPTDAEKRAQLLQYWAQTLDR